MSSTAKLSAVLILWLALPLWGASVLPRQAWSSWGWDGEHLHWAALPAPAAPPAQAPSPDLDGDGRAESLALSGGRVTVWQAGRPVWRSPAEWQVLQAEVTDLNHDGRLEAALLVWRPYRPWPVDRLRPHGGRIEGHHDAAGRSCQLILVGWRRGEWGELWAGSALARPVLALAAVDLNGDGRQELAVLEGDYAAPGAPAQNLALWTWNSFGFDLLARRAGRFSALQVFRAQAGRQFLQTRN